jgi:hypothetical protein
MRLNNTKIALLEADVNLEKKETCPKTDCKTGFDPALPGNSQF